MPPIVPRINGLKTVPDVIAPVEINIPIKTGIKISMVLTIIVVDSNAKL